MAQTREILGVILAGGQARRMGGGDKGLAMLDGMPMLARVIARLRPQVDHLILNANGPPGRFAAFGLTVVPDPTAQARGPLEGLAAAMVYARAKHPSVGALVTVSTDLPFLPDDLVPRLTAAGVDQPAIAVSDGRRHPVIGLWPVSMHAAVSTALETGALSLNAFADRHGAVEVAFPLGDCAGQTIDPFFNANTPEDLDIARRLLGAQSD